MLVWKETPTDAIKPVEKKVPNDVLIPTEDLMPVEEKDKHIDIPTIRDIQST